MECYCPACGSKLNSSNIGEYSECKKCGTYKYISNRSDIDENKEYFENREYYQLRPKKIFKFIFNLYRLFELIFDFRLWQSKLSELKINSAINSKNSLLEIGFGNGRWLARKLKNQKDAYGIDLSSEAISAFQEKYPQFSKRVIQATCPKGSYDLVYANAIFEHIDNPETFLKPIHESLNENGYLVLGIPTVNIKQTNILISDDINFWKPCHRVIYSQEGLKQLMQKNGFRIKEVSSYDLAVYRLMNSLLKNKLDDVHKYRNPFLDYDGKNNFLFYVKNILSMPFFRSRAVWSKILLEKI